MARRIQRRHCRAAAAEITDLIDLRLHKGVNRFDSVILPQKLAVFPIVAATPLGDPQWSAAVARAVDIFARGLGQKTLEKLTRRDPPPFAEGAWIGADDGIRTRTLKEKQILSLLRLPISPRPHPCRRHQHLYRGKAARNDAGNAFSPAPGSVTPAALTTKALADRLMETGLWKNRLWRKY